MKQTLLLYANKTQDFNHILSFTNSHKEKL